MVCGVPRAPECENSSEAISCNLLELIGAERGNIKTAWPGHLEQRAGSTCMDKRCSLRENPLPQHSAKQPDGLLNRECGAELQVPD